MRYVALMCAAILLPSCSQETGEMSEPPQPRTGGPAAGQAEASLVTVEGRVESGTECAILRTPGGEVWAVNFTNADVGPGDYIRLTGAIADAGFCMEGRGTLTPRSIEAVDPPAADRDPARAGGTALDRDYVTGAWTAKGLDADCGDPDFRIAAGAGGTVLTGNISRHDDSALVILGNYPRIDLDEPMDDLPIEARGPDGLAIMRPATDAAYDPVTIGGTAIEGDGVVFVKCG
ncbi:hypothetical protein A9D14_00130 [Croceicoccus marinus]|uniref:Uncharacterized protein n=2 Tax=Croceicoccus marinus TaxID=450378 RepID=A0A1Z1F807_9SPHN|nr:hypothetical protein A9D14_00130 [Croceicoccus marinus]